MSETISPRFTFEKGGILHFSRRIPKELRCHYISRRIASSLRMMSAKIADVRARKTADQLDDYWFHLSSATFPTPRDSLRATRGASGFEIQARLRSCLLKF